MKKNVIATANAAALVGGIWYLLCVLLVVVSRSSYMEIIGTWFHGVDYNSLPPSTVTPTSFWVGLISFAVFVWVSGYFFAVFYNKFVKK